MPRKKGAKSIPLKVRKYVEALAVDRKYRTDTAESLARKIAKELYEEWDLAYVPAWESLQDIVQEARRFPPSDYDVPWSVAASVQHGLPAEATRDLFYIWRVSLAIDRPITVRQARWIAHLRTLYPVPAGPYSHKAMAALTLINRSWLCGVAERVSEISPARSQSAGDFDSSAIDAAIFMPPWENATALQLDRIGGWVFPAEVLARIEEKGDIPLRSTPESIRSVEEAVWRGVRSEPPGYMEVMADVGRPEDLLPEEEDLVAAYWLSHLSKGPLWDDLPEQPLIEALARHARDEHERAEKAGNLALDSDWWPDDSLYSRQLSIRRRVLDWVRTDSIRRSLLHSVRTGSFIEQATEAMRIDLPAGQAPPFNATLLTAVGYSVPSEQMEVWLRLHEAELRVRHKGFGQLRAEIRQRFVRDEETWDDREALREADYQTQEEQEARQQAIAQEFIDLVRAHGEPHNNRAFWEPIRKEWFQKRGIDQAVEWDWQSVRSEYERVVKEQSQGKEGGRSAEGPKEA